MRAPWSTTMIEALAEYKRAGLTFDAAWSLAYSRNPPRGREFGPQGQLGFDSDPDEPFDTYLRRVCSDSWHGRRPALKHWHYDQLMDPVDSGGRAASMRTGQGSRKFKVAA